MSRFQVFIDSKLIVAEHSQTKIANIGRAWVEYHGTASGKSDLYKYLITLPNVSKTSTMFKGLDIQQTITTITPPIIEAQQMTAYQQAMIDIELKKLEQQTIQQKERLLAEKELKEKELLAEKELKEKELLAEKERLLAERKLKEKELLAKKERLLAERELKEKELERKVEMKKHELQQDMDKFDRGIEVDMEKFNRTLEDKEKARQHISAENDKKLSFMRETNNINRKMFDEQNANFNKYLDMKVYGTPSIQYITPCSLKDVISTNIAIHDVPLGLADDLPTLKTSISSINNVVAQIVEQQQEQIVVMNTNGKADTIMAIDSAKVTNMVTDILDSCKQNQFITNKKHHWPDLIEIKLTAIKDISSSDSFIKNYPTHYETCKNLHTDTRSSMPDKDKCLRERNMPVIKDLEMHIRCYCCQRQLRINDAAIHRSHNIPDCKDGSRSKENLYLCCSTCNQSMGKNMTVESYTIQRINASIKESN